MEPLIVRLKELSIKTKPNTTYAFAINLRSNLIDFEIDVDIYYF